MRSLSVVARFALAPVALALAGAVAIAACSGSDSATHASTGTTSGAGAGAGGGGGAGGGAGGSGGASPSPGKLCVSSPSPAPFPGTDDCPAPVPAAKDTLDAALAEGGLDRCHVRLLPEDIALSGWGSDYLVDKRRLPDFTPLQRGPLRLPGYGKETASWLDAAAASPNPVSGTIEALSVRRGHAFADACMDLGPYLPADGDATPLATAVLALEQHHGDTGNLPALQDAAATVPLELQKKLAPIVGAIDLAATTVDTALGGVTGADRKYLARSFSLYVPATFSWPVAAEDLAKLDAVDVGAMSEAAALLARTIEDADLAAIPASTFTPFEVTTPIGRIVIHDGANDTYASKGVAEGAALLVDVGGDDTYEVGAGAADDTHPVSVAIDLRGADHYGYHVVASPLDGDLLPSDGKGRYSSAKPPTEDYGPITLSRTPRQGAGTAGIGLLFDLGTEGDHYRSLAVSQGFASAGVGVLYDAGGDDVYEAEIASQGSATFGVAALVDAGGNDQYRSFTYSQGFGGAEGAGALVDRSGDDVYFVDPGDPAIGGHPLYFTPQLPGQGNSSMSQGAAQGRRPQDQNDASYMAGGVGILRDAAGADHYTGRVFAQGVGYWQGLGMLLEGGGDDTYDASWYIQGSTAHFALSLFLEEGGNDHYDETIEPAATSIGVGHDFSASLHLDLGGDDVYHAPGLSLGSGNIDGIGCLVNVGGNDTYVAAGDPTLGAGNYSSEAPYGEPRQDAPTIGIFVDAGGTDTYEVGGQSRALDDTTWSYEPQPYPAPQMVDTEHGCGADDGAGSVTLP